MGANNEQLRFEFSQRLAGELTRIGLPANSPTRIARTFNQKYPGMNITAQTVRKWLMAEAIPTQLKLMALSSWFGVSAQWLRFGTGQREETDTPSIPEVPYAFLKTESRIRKKVIRLSEMMGRLSEKDLRLLEGIVRLMLQEATEQEK